MSATRCAAAPMAADLETAVAREPRLDEIVARSRAAADAFRRIADQEAVDRIVLALVVDFHLDDRRPEGRRPADAAAEPCLSVGSGNAPVHIDRAADVPMAAVDMVISTTFDASLSCPARADRHHRRSGWRDGARERAAAAKFAARSRDLGADHKLSLFAEHVRGGRPL